MNFYKNNSNVGSFVDHSKALLPGQTSMASVRQGHNDQKGILGKANYWCQSKMTPTKIEEHKSKIYVFFCHERYNPTHVFP